MTAYWIGRAQQIDDAGYVEYGRLRAEAAKLYPQQALARGGRHVVLEGDDDFNRFVLIKFASVEAAVAYYNSPEYQLAAAVRKAASGKTSLVITEGLPD